MSRSVFTEAGFGVVATMIHDEQTVEALFQQSLQEAKNLLAGLSVAGGREPSFSGLTGWVFEKTIQHCIRQELELRGLAEKIEEQIPLKGRAKVDLGVGRIAVEIKTLGLFGQDQVAKCKKYQSEAAERGYRYVFLSRTERTFRTAIMESLRPENVVFLDEPSGEWKRFIEIIADDLKRPGCENSLVRHDTPGDK